MSHKPLISFCLFTYNQASFIAQAIDGAFAQTYENMEIIISDDGSSDETWSIVEKKSKLYQGPHKLTINRNKVNMGVAAHVNKLVSMSHGDIVVIAAGDDISLPSRASRIADAFESHTDAMMVESLENKITPNGKCTELSSFSGQMKYVDSDPNRVVEHFPCFKGAVLAYRRRVFTEFGPLPADCWAEDIILSMRACMLGKVVRIEEPLIYYRTAGGISSGRSKTLEKSVRVNRGRMRCYEQLYDDALSLGVPNLEPLKACLKSRIEGLSAYIVAISDSSLWVRLASALKYMKIEKNRVRAIIVLALSALPLSVRRLVFH